MKLISKFHDYYDTALAHGRDDTIVYVRERSDVRLELPSSLLPWEAKDKYGHEAGPGKAAVYETHHAHFPAYAHWSDKLPMAGPLCVRLHEAFVVVGGQAYPIWLEPGNLSVLLESTKTDPIGSPSEESFRAVLAERHAQMRDRPRDEQVDIQIRHTERPQEIDGQYQQARRQLLAHDFTDLHIEQGAPVLLLSAPITVSPANRSSQLFDAYNRDKKSNAVLIRNPCLKDLGFQRTLDPHTCFQNISQFIGGVMPGRQMPMVQLTDKDMVQKRGFDPKYSFRTRPTGR